MTHYLLFAKPLLRWPGVVRSVPQATDLPVVKGLRSRDSPLLSLRPSLLLLLWNWAWCTSLDHSKAIKWPLSAVASIVLWCQLSSSFCCYFFSANTWPCACVQCIACACTVQNITSFSIIYWYWDVCVYCTCVICWNNICLFWSLLVLYIQAQNTYDQKYYNRTKLLAPAVCRMEWESVVWCCSGRYIHFIFSLWK